MGTRIPASYKRYRALWIVIHAALLVALLLAAANWCAFGGGDRLFAQWADQVMIWQYDLANTVPFPWD